MIARAEIADTNERMIELLSVNAEDGDQGTHDPAARWFQAQGVDVAALVEYVIFCASIRLASSGLERRDVPVAAAELQDAISQAIAFGWLLHQLHGPEAEAEGTPS